MIYPEFNDVHDAEVMHWELGLVQGLVGELSKTHDVRTARAFHWHLPGAVAAHGSQGRVRPQQN